ncbi:hypothetical protein FDW83_03600 [Pseudarthrobacter sp. NamE2]|uniref:ArnT family glycosyltransferase n=1 Tax=Pseudarthrobacter sp. NamE2 TaxID=2576838 RepID=UPI0010FEFC73|nr:glycosyltransferase family 39 protein [Pseudarthrobacter sp. NamE2]TLM85479.1 hypothetical protein FDW83_03600 [Pseudarthrobacter sp. NamE2]
MSVAETSCDDASTVKATSQGRRWQASALVFLHLSAATTYVWGVDRNGWANAYYSAAVQAGQHDPQAFLFGSADWGNSITVDKPPLSLWLMGLSAQVFGLSPWSIMLPQAAVTVVSTFLVYSLMARHFPFWLALFAATAFAFAPITVLLARYNNPDPLMVLLMVAGLYAGICATETGRHRYLYLTSILLSLGFLTKQLQAFLVLPAIVITFLLFAGYSLRKRLFVLIGAGSLLSAASLAWPLFMDLTPYSNRPYIGGSSTNSVIELILGYNGIERVLEQGDVPSTALIPEQFRSVDSDAGFFRLFNVNYGQELGWLLLPALASCVVILVKLIRRSYDHRQSITACASLVWMLTTYVVLSFMGDSFHSYYTASLALPMALCLGLGMHATWSRTSPAGRLCVAAVLVASFIFSRAMWQLSSAFPEWLGTAVFLLGLCAAAALSLRAPRPWIAQTARALAIFALLLGPFYCSALTLQGVQGGSNPLSGGITKSFNSLSRFLAGVKESDPAWAAGVAVGFEPPSRLADVLRNTASECTWAAATYPGQTAARYQLTIDRPVIAIGGFAATDPSPTLAQFKDWVKQGDICYLVEQPHQLEVPGNSQELTAIQQWVTATYNSEVIGGVTVYDLTS